MCEMPEDLTDRSTRVRCPQCGHTWDVHDVFGGCRAIVGREMVKDVGDSRSYEGPKRCLCMCPAPQDQEEEDMLAREGG